ncbi:MAG: J domain-containing protein [Cyanobacteria bacterium P01_A01_bin.17]
MNQKHSSGNSSPAALTYYKLLGLSSTASEDDVRRAYRQKSKLYHPDTTELPLEKAAEQFQKLKEAYTTLSNAEARRNYDRQFRSPVPSSRRPPAPVQQSVHLNAQQRPLSPGEVFALFLLGITFLVCLVLALVVGTAQSESWRAAQRPPEWAQPVIVWFQQQTTASAPNLSEEEARLPLE